MQGVYGEEHKSSSLSGAEEEEEDGEDGDGVMMGVGEKVEMGEEGEQETRSTSEGE